jgi:hypothetical protein
VFLSYLRKAFEEGKLRFHGEMAGLAKPAAFETLCLSSAKISSEPKTLIILRHSRMRS